jgi:hypothetical protein
VCHEWRSKEVLEEVRRRLRDCQLELHPEKTKIVHCKDDRRRGVLSEHTFDTWRTWNLTVGTTKKSMAIVSARWFLRNAFHVAEDGFRCRTMYFSTVDFATSMLIFRSSPTILGEPHVGLEEDIFRMR